MKNVNVGVLGAVINNENMGCVALTYSLLNLLEQIDDSQGLRFTYYVFEGNEDIRKTNLLCKQLKIEKSRLISVPIDLLFRLRSMIHYPVCSIKVLMLMKLLIDV